MPKKPVPAMVVADSSSDDEAPEEISVSSSRQQGVSQLQDIQNAERQSKLEEREKRRKRNEMFRIQKEKKLQDLSKRRLPQDVLDAVSANSKSQPQEAPKKKLKTTNADGNDDEDEEDDDSDEDQDEFQGIGADNSDDRLSDSGVEDGGEDAEFLPIGNSGSLALVTEEALAKKKLSSAQKAVNFKFEQLYNQPTIPRESAKQRRARAAKKRANQLR